MTKDRLLSDAKKARLRKKFETHLKACLNDPNEMAQAVNAREVILYNGKMFKSFDQDSLNDALKAIDLKDTSSQYQLDENQKPRIPTELTKAGLSQEMFTNLSTSKQIKYASAVHFALSKTIEGLNPVSTKVDIEKEAEQTLEINEFKQELQRSAKPMILQEEYNQAHTNLLATIKSSTEDSDIVGNIKSLGQSILKKIEAYKQTGKAPLSELTQAIQATQEEIAQVIKDPTHENTLEIIQNCIERGKQIDALMSTTNTFKARLHEIKTTESDESDKTDYRRYTPLK